MIDYRNTVDLLLSAVHNHVGKDGLLSTFLFSIDPDTPDWKKKLGTTILISLIGMTGKFSNWPVRISLRCA